jgi:hypothetical protein
MYYIKKLALYEPFNIDKKAQLALENYREGNYIFISGWSSQWCSCYKTFGMPIQAIYGMRWTPAWSIFWIRDTYNCLWCYYNGWCKVPWELLATGHYAYTYYWWWIESCLVTPSSTSTHGCSSNNLKRRLWLPCYMSYSLNN